MCPRGRVPRSEALAERAPCSPQAPGARDSCFKASRAKLPVLSDTVFLNAESSSCVASSAWMQNPECGRRNGVKARYTHQVILAIEYEAGSQGHFLGTEKMILWTTSVTGVEKTVT